MIAVQAHMTRDGGQVHGPAQFQYWSPCSSSATRGTTRGLRAGTTAGYVIPSVGSGSKSSKATATGRGPHLNPMLVACESLGEQHELSVGLPDGFYAQSPVRGGSGCFGRAVLATALGGARPVSQALWNALSPLDRYALLKVASRGKPERLQAAYAEIVGHSALSTHLGPAGGARMVDVSQKTASHRHAVAESRVSMSADVFARVKTATVPKGDVLGTARLAGIMGAKRTAELIPLCHPLALTKLELTLELDDTASAISVRATVEAFDRTGVEMEALTAVSVAALPCTTC